MQNANQQQPPLMQPPLMQRPLVLSLHLSYAATGAVPAPVLLGGDLLVGYLPNPATASAAPAAVPMTVRCFPPSCLSLCL